MPPTRQTNSSPRKIYHFAKPIAGSRNVTINDTVRYIAEQHARFAKHDPTVKIMNNHYRLALILALLFAAGCGQSGPLYLPGNPSEIKTDVPPQDQNQAEEEDEDEDKEPQEEN